MLTKVAIENQLKQNAYFFRSHGISKIGLFGSYLRDAQKKQSDIDILIDFKEGEETFDNFSDVCVLLDSLFSGYKVDVVTANGLSPHIGPHILKSVEYVEIFY